MNLKIEYFPLSDVYGLRLRNDPKVLVYSHSNLILDKVKNMLETFDEETLKENFMEGSHLGKCWRKEGCIFNSNFPSFMKCNTQGYSVDRCHEEHLDEHMGRRK